MSMSSFSSTFKTNNMKNTQAIEVASEHAAEFDPKLAKAQETSPKQSLQNLGELLQGKLSAMTRLKAPKKGAEAERYDVARRSIEARRLLLQGITA